MEKITTFVAAFVLGSALLQKFRSEDLNTSSFNYDLLKIETLADKKLKTEKLYKMIYDENLEVGSCINYDLLQYISENLGDVEAENLIFNGGAYFCPYCVGDKLLGKTCKQNLKFFDSVPEKYLNLYFNYLSEKLNGSEVGVSKKAGKLENIAFG